MSGFSKTESVDCEIVVPETESGAIKQITGGEISEQRLAAIQQPRDLVLFHHNVIAEATIDTETAAMCQYKKPQGNGFLYGPSIRLAEIIIGNYANARISARLIEVGREFVTCQAMFLDMQTNMAIALEVSSSIVKADGHRFGNSLIATTIQATQSKALREVVFKGVGVHRIRPMYAKIMDAALGKDEPIVEHRAKCLKHLTETLGIPKPNVFYAAGVDSEGQLDHEKIMQLRKLVVSLKDGEATRDELFPQPPGMRHRRGATAQMGPDPIAAAIRSGGGEQDGGPPKGYTPPNDDFAAEISEQMNEPKP